MNSQWPHGLNVGLAQAPVMADSYTFTYKWKVSDLETRLHNSTELSSPVFSSPSGFTPTTKWTLTVYNGDVDSTESKASETPPPPPVGEQSLSVELKRRVTRPHSDPDVWVEARLKSQSSNFDDLTEFEATYVSQGPIKLCSPTPGLIMFGSRSNSNDVDHSVIIFNQCLPLFKVQDSQSMTFECEIKVCSEEPSLPTNKSNFSLSRFMEEARQSNLFTDVTLVADGGKEFKAHKVVLASQSQFFKTRFSGRWVSPAADGDRVEMTDVPVVVMEAMLSYMYTGKLTDNIIGKITHQLLPAAEEYGLVGLRRMCEEDLVQLLTTKTVINTLIHASDYNAPDLKKACIEFVVHNTAAVRQSEGWDKLKKDQLHRDLWVELLENIAENH